MFSNSGDKMLRVPDTSRLTGGLQEHPVHSQEGTVMQVHMPIWTLLGLGVWALITLYCSLKYSI